MLEIKQRKPEYQVRKIEKIKRQKKTHLKRKMLNNKQNKYRRTCDTECDAGECP